MKKILIINGGPRIGQTGKAVGILKAKLDKEFSLEVVNLREMRLSMCKGCAVCLQKGEEFCPSKDALADILRKMDEADAIIFASLNYTLGVPGLFKNFFDRLTFVYHRPCFFNKIFASVVTQGVYGGKDIKDHFKRTAGF